MLKLFNSLSNKIEDFLPINEKNITIYCCGITVYDQMHLGHAKTYVCCDVLIRLLKIMYQNITFVRNITDIDDKIIKRAKERGISIQALTTEIINFCNLDMNYLGNLQPTIEPKVTEHIQDIIIFIQQLINNNHAYVKNNTVFFDVKSYKAYGKLSNKNLDELLAGVRIDVNEDKNNPLDFVLWKPATENDDKSSIFNSPWGLGRPGWHIECSTMSNKYLGENFDIHCGGMDLKFPHHENEIAQSCCANIGSSFAKYWFHVGFLMVNGEKMSKSLDNFITIQDLKNKNINGKVVRFLVMKNHYRTPLDFKDKLIEETKKNLIDLNKSVLNIECEYKVPKELINILCEDLNTPKAIALLNDYKTKKEFEKLKNSLLFLNLFDENLIKINKDLSDLPISEKEINNLILERIQAKNNKDWETSDKIRNYLLKYSIVVKDTINSCDWERIN